jgi:hypothetical protein
MRKLVTAGMLAAALLLGGCAAMTPHAVSSFKVQTVAPDSFILTARVYPRRARDEVRREVLVRAAQETLARGFDWYVLKRSNLAEALPGPAAEGAPETALALAPYGRRGFGGMGMRRFRRANNSPRPRDFQVQMFHGDKPAGTQGFVARDVIASLAPPPKSRT